MARREVTGRKPGVSADLIERENGAPEPDDDEPSQRDEPAAQVASTRPPIRGPPRRSGLSAPPKARRKAPLLDEPGDAFTISEFCARHRLSVQMFYKRPDLMPRTFSVGKRRLISRETAARWRAAREAASASEATTA